MKKIFLFICIVAKAYGQTACGINQVKVTLSASQLQNSFASPVNVGLPLPGGNNFYEVISASLYYHYNGTPFNCPNNAAILIYNETSPEAQASSSTVLTNIGDKFLRFNVFGSDIPQLTFNKDLVIRADGISTVGNGTMDIYITYKVGGQVISAPVLDTIVTLTPFQVASIFTLPVTLIQSPGTNKTIEVVSITDKLIFNTTAYLGHQTLIVKTATATDQQATGTVLNYSANCKHLMPVSAPVGLTQLIPNQPLIATTLSGNPTTGDSSIELHIYYRIVDY